MESTPHILTTFEQMDADAGRVPQYAYNKACQCERCTKRRLANKRRAANARDKDSIARSLGLTKVRGARGGTYWE